MEPWKAGDAHKWRRDLEEPDSDPHTHQIEKSDADPHQGDYSCMDRTTFEPQSSLIYFDNWGPPDQCFGSGLDLNSITSVDPYPDPDLRGEK